MEVVASVDEKEGTENVRSKPQVMFEMDDEIVIRGKKKKRCRKHKEEEG